MLILSFVKGTELVRLDSADGNHPAPSLQPLNLKYCPIRSCQVNTWMWNVDPSDLPKSPRAAKARLPPLTNALTALSAELIPGPTASACSGRVGRRWSDGLWIGSIETVGQFPVFALEVLSLTPRFSEVPGLAVGHITASAVSLWFTDLRSCEKPLKRSNRPQSRRSPR